MDFYVIPPLSNLELMNEGKGNRFFCLAQLYKKHAHYREFFKQKVKDGAWVTLDNGAGDHDIVTMKDLIDLTLDLRPSEVIPPDILFDGISTIRNLEEFIWKMDELSSIYETNTSFLGCPQGRTKEEWLFVYEYMLQHPNVSTIGLSKIAVPKVFLDATNDELIKEARWMAYFELRAKNLISKPIHFLGMGDPREMELYKNDPYIRSTDSCNSVWSAMNCILWEDGNFQRVPTPKNYFERPVIDRDIKYTLSNINWFKNLLTEK